MARTAAKLVDRVLPAAPLRQWTKRTVRDGLRGRMDGRGPLQDRCPAPGRRDARVAGYCDCNASPGMTDRYVFGNAPSRVYWEITRACDLACRHCRAEAVPTRDPRELDTAAGLRLLA